MTKSLTLSAIRGDTKRPLTALDAFERVRLVGLINKFVTSDLEWCPTGEFTIKQNKLLDVIPEWGPAWKISFQLYILSFPTVSNNDFDNFENFLRFTSTTNDCCSIGDRIPALYTHSNNSIYYATNIDGVGNKVAFSPYIQTGKWYSFEIEQQFSDNQVKMEV